MFSTWAAFKLSVIEMITIDSITINGIYDNNTLFTSKYADKFIDFATALITWYYELNA